MTTMYLLTELERQTLIKHVDELQELTQIISEGYLRCSVLEQVKEIRAIITKE